MANNDRPPQKPGASLPPQPGISLPPFPSASEAPLVDLNDPEMKTLLSNFVFEGQSTSPATASSTGSDLQLLQNQHERLMVSAPSGQTSLMDWSSFLAHLPVPHGIPNQQAVGQISACAPTFSPLTMSSSAHNQQRYGEIPNFSNDQRAQTNSLAVDQYAHDDYNWRMAGKWTLKDTEFPRKYLECKIPGCPAKKKVDRSSDGQITHISHHLKHEHNHPPPQKKQRNNKSRNSEAASARRTVTETKTIIEMPSEIKPLDDTYQWQNNRQIFVKGNSNPRRYYQCTTPGCGAKKCVERSKTDPKCFITTYKGEHNHVAPDPAARTRIHEVTNSIASQLREQNKASGSLALGDKGDSSR